MDKIKLKIINYVLDGLRWITLKFLQLQAKYAAGSEIGKTGKFDMRNMAHRMKNLILHDQDALDKRWNECQKCEFLKSGEKFGKEYHNCEKCGCFMKVGEQFIKIKLATQSCPIGKWGVDHDVIKKAALNGSSPTP